MNCHAPPSIRSRTDVTLIGLRQSDVDVVTFGQYMRPTKKHMKVDRYVLPEEFEKWKEVAEGMGFLYVASGPLVRSSYKVSRFSILCAAGSDADGKTRRENSSSRMY